MELLGGRDEIVLCFVVDPSSGPGPGCLRRYDDDAHHSAAPEHYRNARFSHGAKYNKASAIYVHGNVQHGADVSRAAGALVHRQPVYDDADGYRRHHQSERAGVMFHIFGYGHSSGHSSSGPRHVNHADGNHDNEYQRHGPTDLPLIQNGLFAEGGGQIDLTSSKHTQFTLPVLKSWPFDGDCVLAGGNPNGGRR